MSMANLEGVKTPADLVAAWEAAATVLETPCGKGRMVWHRRSEEHTSELQSH